VNTQEDILALSRPAVSVLDFPRGRVISFLVDNLRSAGVREAYIIGSLPEIAAGHGQILI